MPIIAKEVLSDAKKICIEWLKLTEHSHILDFNIESKDKDGKNK